MTKPNESEARALEEAGLLLRYAAQNAKDLDPDLSLAIAEARNAAQNEAWSPQISQRFWTAFSRLCGLVQSVTVDSLAAAARGAPTSGWLPWRDAETISIAERSSARYLRALLVLLATIVPLQLYVWTSTNLSRKIDDYLAATKSKVVQLTEEYNRLKDRPSAAGGRPSTVASGFDDKGEAFKTLAYAVHIDLERIGHLVKVLQVVTLGRRDDGSPDKSSDKSSDKSYEYWQTASAYWGDYFDPAIRRFEWTQEDNNRMQQRGNLIVGVIGSFVLPVLFGTIGAVAFIIRSTSDQIRDSTFSTSSPIRNVMRVALGALAGVVVGLFGDLSTQLSLSPLAIAFLAGYGVEAVFSMFEGLAQKFRQAAA